MKTETPIQRDIIKTINASGLATVWRCPSGEVRVRRGYLHMAPKGTPDIVGYTRDGKFVGIEVKVPGNRTDKARAESQLAARVAIIAAGGIAAEVQSPQEAIDVLRGIVRSGI